MALKFRLRGLAETFIDELDCPGCGCKSTEDDHFHTELTRVTFEGIVVVAQCLACGEIFVPEEQRRGVLDPNALQAAVSSDARETGEPLLPNFQAVQLNAEKLNALRKGELH